MYQRDMSAPIEYDEKYFQHYVECEDTEIARKLNEARISLSHKYCNCILDMGIGSGEFIKKSTAKMYGYDVNDVAIEWLLGKNIWANPYEEIPEDVEGLTFWDVLEHIRQPSELLKLVRPGTFVFISLPTFTDLTKVRTSKHYKPNEHLYYYSITGLIKFMAFCNFELIELSDAETKAGRQDITSFVFRKLPDVC